MPSEGECERTGAGNIPRVLPLAWRTAVPEECKEIGWEGKEHELSEKQPVRYGGRSLFQLREKLEKFV